MNSTDYTSNLLEQERVAVIPGSAFGENGEGFMRLSYAASEQTIEQALEGMRRYAERI